MKKQKGIVLFFAIIVLLLLTVIGVSLASNSTMSIKMAGAGTERIEALVNAQGKIENGVRSIVLGQPMSAEVVTRIPSLSCPRKARANSNNQGAGTTELFCREIGVTETYGKSDTGQLTLVVGIDNIPEGN